MSNFVSLITEEFICSANLAFSFYPGITRGIIKTILALGTEEQKKFYIPKMVTGQWTGTMNITEPQCGSNLDLIKTEARKNSDKTYSISGEKIFITSGEQDLSENIIHLVLARIKGSKNLSLFIVPKLINNKKNSIICARVEDKMGINGSATCNLFYKDATGYLLGKENKGLVLLMPLFNEMRLVTAIQGLSQSELAYQNAVKYARNPKEITMLTYKAPVEESIFLIKDVLKVEDELLEPIIQESAKFIEEVIVPTNQPGDKEGCVLIKKGPGQEYNEVTAPICFRDAWKQYTEAGWLSVNVPEQYGGQGQTYIVASAVNEYLTTANLSLGIYAGLTRGAITALLKVGSDAFKQHYIPRMANGQWTGTMNLTEPHCGTDLGLIKTKAIDKGNGSYEITGQKIFISCGEHNLSDNIIHLVLARIEGAPDGVKGLSMFVVPKILADTTRNKLEVGVIEEKMGIHGSPTCQMFFDGATGYIIGKPGEGLVHMYIMMNEARLGVAMQGLGQSELAYQNALLYAKDRLQGRSLTGPKNPDGPADPIIVHPDVRRMLLDIKSVTMPSRLLFYKASLLCDKEDEVSKDILGLMTPVLKGVLTDYGFEHAVKAQQIFGGHGYIKEWGMEQIVRDARIAQIYEGTNGIQAMDLVGRKLPKNMGQAVRTQFKMFEDQLEKDLKNEDVNKWAYHVDYAYQELKKATQWLVQNGLKNPDDAGSAAYDYMKLFGLVYMGFAWLDIVKVAKEKNMEDKLKIADYFVNRVLPETGLLWQKIQSGSKIVMDLPVDKF